jgi:uncharacterized protein with PQ loop repeat
MVFSTGLANPLIELPDAAKHFKTWWYKNVSTHLIFSATIPSALWLICGVTTSTFAERNYLW